MFHIDAWAACWWSVHLTSAPSTNETERVIMAFTVVTDTGLITPIFITCIITSMI
jgi:hypothetical protein